MKHPILGIVIILIGLSMIGGFHIFNLLIALLIIWLGVKLLTGKSPSGFYSSGKSSAHEDFIKRFLVFSGVNKKIVSDNFEGAEIGVVFGSCEFDLSEVKTDKKEIELNLVAVFSGIKIKIPKNWNVKTDGMGIMGGFDNATMASSKGLVTVRVKGVAIFGGVEIVN